MEQIQTKTCNKNYSKGRICSDCGVPITNTSKGKCFKCTFVGKKRPPFSKEWLEKLRLSRIGKKRSKETRKRMSLAMRGKKRKPFSEECRRKMSESHMIKGIPTNRYSLHRRIWMLYGKADRCDNPLCSGECKRYEWSNKKHDYKTVDRVDWQRLCCICHTEYDMKNNGKYSKNE